MNRELTETCTARSVIHNYFLKCHLLFDVKEHEQFDLMSNDITLKHNSHKKILGVTIDNKLSFDEHINNICKTAHKKLNGFSRINHCMKKKKKKKKIKRKYYCNN